MTAHEFDDVLKLLKPTSSIVATNVLIILNGQALVGRQLNDSNYTFALTRELTVEYQLSLRLGSWFSSHDIAFSRWSQVVNNYPISVQGMGFDLLESAANIFAAAFYESFLGNKRPFEDSVAYACKAMNSSPQRKTLWSV